MNAAITAATRTHYEAACEQIRRAGDGTLADLLEMLLEDNRHFREALERTAPLDVVDVMVENEARARVALEEQVDVLHERVRTLESDMAQLLHRLSDAIPMEPYTDEVHALLAGERD